MREMKDSGMSWVGTVPKHWLVEKVKYHLYRYETKNQGDKQVLSVYREYGVIPKDSRDDNHNVTSEDTSKYKYVKPNDFVINKMKAWQGSMGVSEYEGIVSPAYFIYHFKDKQIIPKYLHYLFRGCYKDEFRRISGGIREGQWDLSPELFGGTMLLIPPTEEQHFIIEQIDKVSTEIDALSADIQAEIDTLQAYKQSVITEAVTKGLDKNVALKKTSNTWIKEVPNNWKFLKVGNLFVERAIKADGTETPLSLSQKDGLVKTDDMVEHSMKTKSYDGWKKVWPNDLILNRFKAHLGVFFCSKYNGMVSFHYGVFIPKIELNVKYYEYLFHSKPYCEMFADLSNGVTVGLQNLGNQTFYSAKCVCPPIEEQNAIVNYLDATCSEIENIIAQKQEQLEVLSDYKKSLIYEYVTGKKEVPTV